MFTDRRGKKEWVVNERRTNDLKNKTFNAHFQMFKKLDILIGGHLVNFYNQPAAK